MKNAPKQWISKTAKRIRSIAKQMGKKISVRSSKIMAKETWKHGMKEACRTKAVKKYG